MLKTIAKKFQRFRPESASVRNVLKLAGGTAGSQVIAVAAAPILTRLYGPESFGVFATFVSILALLNVVASMRYELAIPIPEDDDEAIALVWLCFVLVTVSTAITALGVILFGHQLVVWLHQPALKPLLWILPVGVLVTGVYQPLNYLAIRCKQFGLLAQTKFLQSIFGVVANLALAPMGAIGLLLGQIVSQTTGSVAIFRQSFGLTLRPVSLGLSAIVHFGFDNSKGLGNSENIQICQSLLERMRASFYRLGKFSFISTLSGAINALGSSLPILILSSGFGADAAGQFDLVSRLMLLPASLVSASISAEILSRAATLYLEARLKRELIRSFRFLLIISVGASFLFLIAAPLLPFLFGLQWESLPTYLLVALPRFIGITCVSSISSALIVTSQRRYELMAHSCQAVLIILAAFIGVGLETPEQGYLAYGLGSLLGYMSFFAIMLIAASPPDKSKANSCLLS